MGKRVNCFLLCHSCLILSRSILWPLSLFESCCCCCSIAQSYPNLSDPWTVTRQAPLSSTNSWHLFKFMSIESVMLSNHLILWCPLLLLPSILPNIRVFSNELVLLIRWPKNWSFSISSSNEYSGLIYFRIDWFDLLAVQGTQESSPPLQFKSINSNSLVFGLLYGSPVTSIHDCWKNHSFD